MKLRRSRKHGKMTVPKNYKLYRVLTLFSRPAAIAEFMLSLDDESNNFTYRYVQYCLVPGTWYLVVSTTVLKEKAESMVCTTGTGISRKLYV